MFGVFSRGVARIPHLDALLGSRWTLVRPGTVVAFEKAAGWGCKATSQSARRYAAKHNLPYVSLEDGFLRSVGLGVNGVPPLSLVLDDIGIYYDAGRPSKLENIILENSFEEEVREAGRRALHLMRHHRLSKYNHTTATDTPALGQAPLGARRVLVVDQTFGDASVVLGGGSEAVFAAMLTAAMNENNEAEIWLKVHPDVLAGRKKGYLGTAACDRVRLVQDDCCPLGLIAHFDHVYVVTSQMGFDALLLGRPVTCFGNPWYAGWGLTDDRHEQIAEVRQRRCVVRTVEDLFTAAYLVYARYLHPASGKRGSIFDVIEWIVRNRAIDAEMRGTLYCVGMSRWKRAIAKPFLRTSSNSLRFVGKLNPRDLAKLPRSARIVVWGSQHAELRESAGILGIPVMRLEDGFIRSSGLGSDLHAPLSLAVDDSGIYYDPESGSKLESLLNSCSLEESERTRARRLLERLVRLKVSKYNVGTPFSLSQKAQGRKALLVPGQVEDDASVRSGSPMVFRNLDLLAAVRKANPDAWIIYKPHPDVVAGNRKGQVNEADLALLADEVVPDANISDCISAVDEVHTMTSQAGFEGLLFGKVVHCYGAPFYAGWGLTVDNLTLTHRQRRLSIEELTFVALCQYPRYRLPGVDGFCAVEDVIEYLIAHQSNKCRKVGSHWLGRQWRKARQLVSVLAMAG